MIQICPSDALIPIAGVNASVVLTSLKGASGAFDSVLTGGGGAGDNYETGNGNAPDDVGDIGCEANTNEYMIQIYFRPTKIYCIDNRGYAGFITIAKTTNMAIGSVKCQ